jgi:DNA adenine methylase
MQYLGGKSRIANSISQIINKYSQNKDFFSLFCGSGAIESKVVAKSICCNDSHEYLIEMFKAIQLGWIIPDSISKEQYDYIKFHKDEDKALTGFVGFACSFGGKWFGGYAHLKNYASKNYAIYSKNSLLRKMRTLQEAKFTCLDYKNVSIPDGSVVYCDPPYEGTTKYSNSVLFNHGEFWDYMKKISQKNIVFISEYNAPKEFISIWEKPQVVKMDARKQQNIFTNIDKLFVYRGNR